MPGKNWDRGLVVIEGHNGVIGLTAEQVNEMSQLVLWDAIEAAAAQIDISSSSASDAAAGTGARSLRVIGLDANYKVITEVVVPTGVVTTAVRTTKSFLRVFEIVVETAGTGRVNAGDIYAVVAGTAASWTAGVPNVVTSAVCKVPLGYIQGDSAVYVVPDGATCRFVRLQAIAATQAAWIQITVRDISQGAAALNPYEEAHTVLVPVGNSLDQDLRDMGLIFGSKTQIDVRAFGVAASSNLWLRLQMAVA